MKAVTTLILDKWRTAPDVRCQLRSAVACMAVLVLVAAGVSTAVASPTTEEDRSVTINNKGFLIPDGFPARVSHATPDVSFSLDARTFQPVGPVDEPRERLRHLVEVRVSAAEQNDYEERLQDAYQNRAASAKPSRCRDVGILETVYRDCRYDHVAGFQDAFIEHLTDRATGRVRASLICTSEASTLKNPQCVAKVGIFGDVALYYSFSRAYADDAALIDAIVRRTINTFHNLAMEKDEHGAGDLMKVRASASATEGIESP